MSTSVNSVMKNVSHYLNYQKYHDIKTVTHPEDQRHLEWLLVFSHEVPYAEWGPS